MDSEKPPEVDVELLRHNLRLTPEERVRRATEAAKNLLKLKHELERTRSREARHDP